MFQNYLKIALRTLQRNKVYSFINIVGLAVGLSACLIIYLLVSYELSFDTFRPDRERIYRITSSFVNNDKTLNYNQGISGSMPAAIRSELTGVDKLTAFQVFWTKVTIPNGKQAPKKFPEPVWQETSPDIIVTNPDYFDLFAHEWLLGSPQTSFRNPNQVVLTESKMKKYFGEISPENALGRLVEYSDSISATVSGIVKDQPIHSDLRFNDFISFKTIETASKRKRFSLDNWTNTNGSSQAFVKLKAGVEAKSFQAQLDKFLIKHLDQKVEWNIGRKLPLQPLATLHFDTNYFADYNRVVHLPTLYILMGVAVFLLLMAAINFINLNTAQAVTRTKEIGVRKILGSGRQSLVFQFLTETFLLTFLALLVALLMLEPIGLMFDSYFPKNFTFGFDQPNVWLFLASIVVVTALLSGLYPAFVASAQAPVDSLKKMAIGGRNSQRAWLRQGLIVFQFVIAQGFILGTILVATQSKFMLNKDMGFKKDAILYCNLDWQMDNDKKLVLLEKMKQLPEIASISIGELAARAGYSTTRMKYQNGKAERAFEAHQKSVDAAFVPMFGLKLLAGQNLTPSDTAKEFVVNEAFVKAMGYAKPQQAIGQLLDYYDTHDKPIKFPIVGVMADFHFQSLHNVIQPLFIKSEPKYGQSIIFKTNTGTSGDIKALNAKIATIYKAVHPTAEEPLEVRFFDESIAKFYAAEQKMAKLLNTATGIAILISCLGLLGLTTHSVQQRTKEIGIRKVLGASVTNIMVLLSKDFLILVLVAIVVASPLAYYFMNNWLKGFAYRVEISWWLFAGAGFSALLIALLTVSYQSMKAALLNPVESLKTE